jgi:hypothetical protein
MNGPQSWQSAIVDVAIIAAVLAMAVRNVENPAAWSIFSVMVGGRFGVAAGKIASSKIGGNGSV